MMHVEHAQLDGLSGGAAELSLQDGHMVANVWQGRDWELSFERDEH